MTTTAEFYAIRKNDPREGGHFFEFPRGCDSWATREALEAAIEAWKNTVTPNIAARTIFDVRFSGNDN